MQSRMISAAGIAAATAFAVMTSGATPATAAVVLDQASMGPQNAGLRGDAGIEWQQEVTAGITGKLMGVTLFGSGDTRVRVTPGSAFTSGPFQFSTLVDLSFENFIDTSAANILLHAGDRFVIDLTQADLGEPIIGYGATQTIYPRGGLFILWPAIGFGPEDETARFGISLRFETFMEPGIPEPAAWMLMLAGFGGAGGALRRRRKAVGSVA